MPSHPPFDEPVAGLRKALRACLALGLVWWAVAPVAALARADSVQLYGRIDLNLTRSSSQAPWEVTQASNSRWGLRVTEDLGGGLRALVQLESRIQADTGLPESRYWGREAWLGLRAPWGTVRLGRSQSPAQRLASSHDPHGTDGIGSFGSSGLLGGLSALVRLDNALHVELQPAQRLSLQAALQLDEDSPASPTRITSLRVRYDHAPLDVSLSVSDLGPGNRLTSLGGTFTWGVVRPMAQLHRSTRAGQSRLTALVGFTATLGPGRWRVAWSRQDDRSAAQADRTLLAAGLDRALSRRTELYTTVARDTARGRAARNGIELGLRHSF